MSKILNLLALAITKGILMAIVVGVVTQSLIETAVIASISSVVTGCFLIANTIIQDRLQRRHTEYLDSRIQDAVASRGNVDA